MTAPMPAQRLAAVILAAVLLAGCKQDAILKDAAAFSTATTQTKSLAAVVSTQVVDSCRHVLTLLAESNPPSFYDLQHPGQLNTRQCNPIGEQVQVLESKLAVINIYADTLARAGAGQSVDYKVGALAQSLAANKLLTGNIDQGLIDTLANGIANLAFRTERAHLVKQTILANNAALQGLALSIEASFASNACSDTTPDAQGRIRYCSLFENEMVQVQTTYCRRGQRIFAVSARSPAENTCANVGREVPSLVAPSSTPARTAQAPSDEDCSVDAIRNRLRRKHLLPQPRQQASTRFRMAVEIPSGAPAPTSSRLSASEWAARDQLVVQYFNDVNLVRTRVSNGFSYAEAVCGLALAHQQAYDFIARAPDASTPLLDR